MIQSLSIDNFQSHKKSEFDFSNGVNVIIGSSDSGKSAVLRALNWVINNKPSGDSFRSDWGGDTLSLLTIDNKQVHRLKTKNENQYILDTNDKEDSTEIFKAFGADVPQPIKEFLNFNEINFQYQLDTPFLLSNTAGEVAKYLNKIVNLDIIDTALTKIETSRKKLNRDIQYVNNDLSEKQNKLKEFDYLENYEKKVKNLEIKSKQVSELQDKYSKLYNLLQEYEKTNKQLSGLKVIDEKKLKGLELLNKRLSELEDEYEGLNNLLSSYQKISKQLSGLKIVDEKKLKSLIVKAEQRERLAEQHDELQNLLESYQSQSKSLEKVTKEWNSLKEQEKKLTPSLCPLCGQKIK